MRPEVVSHKTETFAHVKLQSPISSDKLAGCERSSRTASRFTKYKSKAMGQEDSRDYGHSCA